MMSRITLFVLLAVAMLCAGCGTVPEKPRIVYNTEIVLISPPSNLMVHVTKPAPDFTPEQYAIASSEKREDYLEALIEKLYKQIDSVNIRLEGLREWVLKNNEIYKSKTTEVKNE